MAPELKFIIYDKTREEFQIPWAGRPLVIGRRADADIQVNEPTMSGLHAKIVQAKDGVRIRDLDSLNGTQVNGVRIVDTLLRPGDQIKIGRAMIVVSGAGDASTGPVGDIRDTVGELEGAQLTQTVKISLDKLRPNRGEPIEEDEHLRLLLNLFETLEEAESEDDVLSKVARVLGQTFQRARSFVFRTDADGEWHESEGPDGGRRPSRTFAAEAARSSSAILSTSLPDDKRFSRSESARISGIETAIAAPASCDGEPVAVLYVDRLGLPPFIRRDLHILGIAANHVTTVLERMARQERLTELNRNLEQLVEDRTAEIKRQSEEIHRLAEAKDELMGIAAHDIRGPLTVIQGTTELIRMRLGEIDTDTIGRSLDLIHGACQGLTRLLSELLDAKAIEAGKITLHKQTFRVRTLIESALPVARLAAEDKRVDLVIEAEEDITLEVDPQRLGQAITNLVLNAVKFSDSGSRILLRGFSEAGHTVIEVEDQGIGIPEEELEGIFGTFEQGEAGRHYGGSGLGLMIARRLVELHQGTLAVESRVGEGTRFTLALPDAVADDTPPAVVGAEGGA